MSVYVDVKRRCGVCRHVFTSKKVPIVSAFGSPDLDLRPPPMERFTLSTQIDSCPRCGYVHAAISKNARRHRHFIKTKEYITCEGHDLKEELAQEFYRYAMILLRDKKPLRAYNAFLHAAWLSDDADDKEGADLCRNKAIALYEKRWRRNANLTLRHIDLLRRVGRFDEAIYLSEESRFNEEIMNNVAAFQKRLAQRGDTMCYRVADCEAVFMHLGDEAFELVKCGQKTVEVRCNDEKRRALKVGDQIIFYKQSNPQEREFATIRELQPFDTFEELYSSFPMSVFGYTDRSVKDMVAQVDRIYTEEQQKEYGALAIVLEDKFPRPVFL